MFTHSGNCIPQRNLSCPHDNSNTLSACLLAGSPVSTFHATTRSSACSVFYKPILVAGQQSYLAPLVETGTTDVYCLTDCWVVMQVHSCSSPGGTRPHHHIALHRLRHFVAAARAATAWSHAAHSGVRSNLCFANGQTHQSLQHRRPPLPCKLAATLTLRQRLVPTSVLSPLMVIDN